MMKIVAQTPCPRQEVFLITQGFARKETRADYPKTCLYLISEFVSFTCRIMTVFSDRLEREIDPRNFRSQSIFTITPKKITLIKQTPICLCKDRDTEIAMFFLSFLCSNSNHISKKDRQRQFAVLKFSYSKRDQTNLDKIFSTLNSLNHRPSIHQKIYLASCLR